MHCHLSDALGWHSASVSLSCLDDKMGVNKSGSKLLTFLCKNWQWPISPKQNWATTTTKNKPFVQWLSEQAQCPLSHWQDKESLKWSNGERDIFQMRWNKSVLSGTPSCRLSLNPCYNSKVKESEHDTSTLL